MVLKFIKSLAISFIVFVLYVMFFYSSGKNIKTNPNLAIESELAEYEAKINELEEKELVYNNLMQEIKALRNTKSKKIADLSSTVDLRNVLKTLSKTIKIHSLNIASFNVVPEKKKFFEEHKFTVKFRGNYNNIVDLMTDQNFLPTNAKLKSFSIEGPVSDSKFIVTETELQFSLFKENGGNT